MKPNRILLAAGVSFAMMLILSCGNHDQEEPWLVNDLSSSSVRSSSSKGVLSSSSVDDTLSSSSEDENLSSSSGFFSFCGPNIECPSSSSEEEVSSSSYVYISSSSSVFYCDGKIYTPPNERCGEGNVIEKQCGSLWFEKANTNLKCDDNNGVVMTKCSESSWYNALDANFKCCKSGVVKTKCGSGWIDPIDYFCFEDLEAVPRCGTRTEIFNPALYECRDDSKIYLNTKVKDGDNNEYDAVLIGKQTWMAKNLDYNVSESACIANKPDNCVTYGRLYNWATALTVCPSGWHLPTEAEWSALITEVGGEEVAAKELKAAELWMYGSNTSIARDYYGFSALPGRYGDESLDQFGDNGKEGYWWSATQHISSSDEAHYQKMFYSNSNVTSNTTSKNWLFSVRCVKD